MAYATKQLKGKALQLLDEGHSTRAIAAILDNQVSHQTIARWSQERRQQEVMSGDPGFIAA